MPLYLPGSKKNLPRVLSLQQSLGHKLSFSSNSDSWGLAADLAQGQGCVALPCPALPCLGSRVSKYLLSDGVWVSELPYPEGYYVLSSDQSRLGDQGRALKDKRLQVGTSSFQEAPVSAGQRLLNYRWRTRSLLMRSKPTCRFGARHFKTMANKSNQNHRLGK